MLEFVTLKNFSDIPRCAQQRSTYILADQICSEHLIDTIHGDRQPMTSALSRTNPEENQMRISSDDLLMQPWFLPNGIAAKIAKLIPPGYRGKLHRCFRDFGCFRCDRKKVPYGSIGFCERCRTRIGERMRQSLKRHQKKVDSLKPAGGVVWYTKQIDRAEELLADLKPKRRSARPSLHVTRRDRRPILGRLESS